MAARVLLLYITAHSGHYRASHAVEQAIRRLNPRAVVRTVDAFRYFNPILSQLIDRAYMLVIRRVPEIWDFLYDNPEVAQRGRGMQRWVHRYNAPKLRRLLDEFRPTVIACTQAFPCGVVAAYKRAAGLPIPLYAVLTDFIPHQFWLQEAVSAYCVGSEAAQARLEEAGIPRARIHHTGIPIDPVFTDGDAEGEARGLSRALALGLDPQQPTVLLMGGGQGLGPIAQVARALDALPQPLQLVVLTGMNISLRSRLTAVLPQFRRRVVVLGHVPFVHELMSFATLVVTKPGGLTTAEALAKRLPIIIVDPIPGQEVKNTEYLLQRQAAVRAQRWDIVPRLVADLLARPERVAALRRAAGALGRPRSALDIAQRLLQHA
ncbi:MAG: galactosyldiacylglycerol synthase [Candidatus Omnitrophica bacterium]|nr:galactosyldiacylglycerol synthase [Candidatus Omnitrophota bacterium]